jgi:hypothetical protein
MEGMEDDKSRSTMVIGGDEAIELLGKEVSYDCLAWKTFSVDWLFVLSQESVTNHQQSPQ